MKPETLEAMRAFADDKRIEKTDPSGSKAILHKDYLQSICFYEHCTYRVLPDQPWYRVALMKHENRYYTTTIDSSYRNLQGDKKNFVRWITDRVYFDLPETENKKGRC